MKNQGFLTTPITHEDIAQAMQAFLAKGGKITVCAPQKAIAPLLAEDPFEMEDMVSLEDLDYLDTVYGERLTI